MFGTCQISSQVRSDKYGGTSLCCAQRRLRFQNTNLTGPTPHNWGDHITYEVCSSTLTAGNPHATFEVAGAGNQLTVWILRHSQRKRGATARLNLRSAAPVLDPTKGVT